MPDLLFTTIIECEIANRTSPISSVISSCDIHADSLIETFREKNRKLGSISTHENTFADRKHNKRYIILFTDFDDINFVYVAVLSSDGVLDDMSLASRILEDTFYSPCPWPRG